MGTQWLGLHMVLSYRVLLRLLNDMLLSDRVLLRALLRIFIDRSLIKAIINKVRIRNLDPRVLIKIPSPFSGMLFKSRTFEKVSFSGMEDELFKVRCSKVWTKNGLIVLLIRTFRFMDVKEHSGKYFLSTHNYFFTIQALFNLSRSTGPL